MTNPIRILFEEINAECAANGETVVTFASDEQIVDYYEQQIENLGLESVDADNFIAWLKSL